MSLIDYKQEKAVHLVQFSIISLYMIGNTHVIKESGISWTVYDHRMHSLFISINLIVYKNKLKIHISFHLISPIHETSPMPLKNSRNVFDSSMINISIN